MFAGSLYVLYFNSNISDFILLQLKFICILLYFNSNVHVFYFTSTRDINHVDFIVYPHRAQLRIGTSN